MASNSLEVLKLDEDFKTGLQKLRPFLLKLNSPEDGKHCKLWIDKLHDSIDSRRIRNTLLEMLCSQVESGSLHHPFNKPPPQGSLRSECSSSSVNTDEDERGCDQSGWNDSCVVLETEELETTYSEFNSDCSHPTCLSGFENPMCNIQHHQSWANFPCGSGVGRQCNDESETVQSLLETIKNLEGQNETLKQEVECHKNTCNQAQAKLQEVNIEVLTLRERLAELQNLHSNIEHMHDKTIIEYKQVFGEKLRSLSDKLLDAVWKNTSLESSFSEIAKKVQVNETKCATDSEKERNQEIKQLRNDFDMEIEIKVKEIQALKGMLSKKSEEIQKMKKKMKSDCDKMQSEISSMKEEMRRSAEESDERLKEKVNKLKKTAFKMHYKLKKGEKHYEECINSLKRDHEIELMSLKTQLKTQNTDQIESLLNHLEVKYKNLVKSIQAKATQQRNCDLMRIKQLEEELMSYKSGSWCGSGQCDHDM